jgi:copper chaperone CopZ
MEKIELNVEGMHCPSCEMLISDSLEELDGVKNSEVDHKSGIVAVEFDDSKTKKEEIIKTIKKEGYKVRK